MFSTIFALPSSSRHMKVLIAIALICITGLLTGCGGSKVPPAVIQPELIIIPPSNPAPILSPLEQIRPEDFQQTWTITVTAESFEQYQELCDDGLVDFCNVGIPGFTPHGMINFMTYLNDLYAYIQAANNSLRYWERVSSRIDEYFKQEKD
jgi:hypothetical protein